MDIENRKWILASHPEGLPVKENWQLETTKIDAIPEGHVLARALYLSVDPYMRRRISKTRGTATRYGYTHGIQIGDLMTGGAVAEVLESNHHEWKAGDLLETVEFGWQEYSVLRPETVTRINTEMGPPHAWLSYLGMPGIKAWCAFEDIGRPRPGNTVLVSAAAGAVGQIVGQLAKLQSCRAIAVASTDEKLDWCSELGFDAGINYRTAENLSEEMFIACPKGIDVFFDNTAGPIHDAAMKNLALGARVIIFGTVSLSDKYEQPDIGERFLREILVARAEVRGFWGADYLRADYLHLYNDARRSLARLAEQGLLRFRTDFMDGLEKMPEAFLRLLTSANMGKQLVRTQFANNLPE